MVAQEFFCGECKFYTRVRLRQGYDRVVEFTCPNCSHKHRRHVTADGRIVEDGRFSGGAREEIVAPKSACSKEPLTEKMRKARHRARDAEVLSDAEQLREQMLIERWMEAGG